MEILSLATALVLAMTAIASPDAKSSVRIAGSSPIDACPQFFDNLRATELESCVASMAPKGWGLSAVAFSGGYAGAFVPDQACRDVQNAVDAGAAPQPSHVVAAMFACSLSVATLAPLPASAVYCLWPGAFEEGRIRGNSIGVLLDFDGTPDGPHMATVYGGTSSPRGGVALTTLARVQARGEGAAKLRAMFVNEKPYIVNDRYAPGSSDKQSEYFAIQRFGFQADKLIPEAEGILNLSRPVEIGPDSGNVDCSDVSGFDGALRKLIESGKLDQLWTPVAPTSAP